MSRLPLTRTLDPADYGALRDSVALVKVDELRLEGQHPHRVWEYALAIEAFERWWNDDLSAAATRDGLDAPWIDVGGAGSPLADILRDGCVVDEITVLDPKLNTGIEAYAGPPAAVLSAISVIEHVADLPRFLDACTRAVRPGGLLVLTMDAQDVDGEDRAHFHWDRQRIFGPAAWRYVQSVLVARGCHPFGRVDWTYHGNHVYDYTFASVVVTKD